MWPTSNNGRTNNWASYHAGQCVVRSSHAPDLRARALIHTPRRHPAPRAPGAQQQQRDDGLGAQHRQRVIQQRHESGHQRALLAERGARAHCQVGLAKGHVEHVDGACDHLREWPRRCTRAHTLLMVLRKA